MTNWNIFLIFPRKQAFVFHANYLYEMSKPDCLLLFFLLFFFLFFFFWKMRKNSLKYLLKFSPRVLSIKTGCIVISLKHILMCCPFPWTVFGVEPDLTREGGSIPVTLTFQEATGKNVMLLPIGASDDGAHSQNEKIDKYNYINGVCTVNTMMVGHGIVNLKWMDTPGDFAITGIFQRETTVQTGISIPLHMNSCKNLGLLLEERICSLRE